MRKVLAVILIQVALMFAIEPNFMKDPSVSPDGSSVCFSWMNDLWSVPFEGGEAKRLTSVKGNDDNPDHSPDGKYIAFNSDREGFSAVYVIPSEGGKARKVITGPYMVVDWFSDSVHLLLTRRQSFTGYKLFKVKIDGTGLKDLNGLGYLYSDLSPDSDSLVFCTFGDPYREKMTGSTNGRLHILDMTTGKYSDLYDSPLTERYPVWSKNGNGIYFARSDSTSFQICRMSADQIGTEMPDIEQLTDFDEWSARDISIARDNDRMAYEFFSEIWTLDPASKKYGKLEIEINEDAFGPSEVIDNNASSTDRFFVSPKGDWLLFKHRFDLFAVPFEGGEIIPVTRDAKGIEDFVILEDNETIYYSTFVEGSLKMFKTGIKNPQDHEFIEWSRDKYIEWIRMEKNRVFVHYSKGEERRRLALKNENTDEFEELVPDKYVQDIELSRDGKKLFYVELTSGLYSRKLYLIDLEKKREKLLFSVDNSLYGLALDPEEKFLFYNLGSTVYRTDVAKVTDFHFEEDKWKKIFNNEKKKGKKEKKKKEELSEFILDDLKEKQKPLLSRPGSNYIIDLQKEMKILYMNEFDGKKYLRKTDYQGKEDEILFEIPGNSISGVSYSDSTSHLFFLQDSRIKALDINAKKIKETPFDLKYLYNRQQVYKNVFDEVHKEFSMGFYDPDMHGVDWEARGRRFAGFLDIRQNSESFSAIIDEMIGEVNSSHTGYYPVSEPEVKRLPTARTGAEFDLTERPEKGIKFSKVYFNSALSSVHNVKEGDILLSVDGEMITENTDIEKLFVNKAGDKIELKIESSGKERIIEIKGLESDRQLKYRHWVEERRRKVEELSDGKVGYIHIQSMNWSSLEKFYDDLFAENFDKKALIIDVRYNGGGYTHDNLIETLTKKQYAFSSRRWNYGKKEKTPFNIWDKPSTVIINENSFSDAEIFPSIYKDLGIGKVIGMPTGGGVIGTGSRTLMDGSSMRMPGNGWWRLNGENMEGNGTQPDIFVDMSFEQKLADNDVQLKKAVELMLESIEKE